ncbi:MAG: lytic murein transglycosylase [Bacteriovoracaceae bacterium]|jgi:membrane-bound lytic murein transglycosylase B|nr:hypothetical protein [Halobacteriovoraceae bacterium]MDP7321154.1 lytic murein transglycosylase [Bacteriovoracaceae bacterium]
MSLKVVFFILFFGQISFSAYANSFEQWKKDYAKRAAKRGLPQKFVLDTLKEITYDKKAVEKDNNQVLLSKKKDYQDFIKRWLRDDNKRIKLGREKLKKHHALLSKIEQDFGVDKEVIVSLWGVETLYGEITGDYNVVRSLASLSFDGRRRKFYETQLNAALRLVRAGHVSVKDLKGSWAGATGQCQFMPSNINAYAVDYDKDGKKDIWHTHADIFASIANLLKKAGWKKDKSVGSLVKNTKGIDLDAKKYLTQDQYRRLGFKNLDGTQIKNENWVRRRPAEIPLKNSPLILRGSNYKPLLRWNNSSLFAAFNILMIDGISKKQ